jgi:hypothetical protein
MALPPIFLVTIIIHMFSNRERHGDMCSERYATPLNLAAAPLTEKSVEGSNRSNNQHAAFIAFTVRSI